MSRARDRTGRSGTGDRAGRSSSLPSDTPFLRTFRPRNCGASGLPARRHNWPVASCSKDARRLPPTGERGVSWVDDMAIGKRRDTSPWKKPPAVPLELENLKPGDAGPGKSFAQTMRHGAKILR